MDPTIIARAAAIVLLAGTVLACALELVRQDLTSASSLPAVDDKMDRLLGELPPCKAPGAEEAPDAPSKGALAQPPPPLLAPRGPPPGAPLPVFSPAPAPPKAASQVP